MVDWFFLFENLYYVQEKNTQGLEDKIVEDIKREKK